MTAADSEQTAEPVRECPVCGRSTEQGWAICPQCGTALDEAADDGSLGLQDTDPAPAKPAEEPEYEPESAWMDATVDAIRIVGRILFGIGLVILWLMFGCVEDAFGGVAFFVSIVIGGVLIGAGALLLGLNTRIRRFIKKKEHPEV